MAKMAIPPRTGKYPQHPCVAATIQFEAQTNNYQQRSVPNHRPCAQTLPHTHTSKEQIDKIAEETEDLPHVLNEIQEKIETLRQIAKQKP